MLSREITIGEIPTDRRGGKEYREGTEVGAASYV